jgi:hypothetical protein
LRSSTLDSLHTGVSPGSIGCSYTYSGPFREAQISVQPLWGFSSSNPDRSQSRAEHYLTYLTYLTYLPNFFKTSDTELRPPVESSDLDEKVLTTTPMRDTSSLVIWVEN